ncbi:putative short-chain dehydrogenases/reductase [Xylariales sp. PMI_506]|nr:putative short-chain dehydrogenases/reductase [Xylariales sp. PMI_506]
MVALATIRESNSKIATSLPAGMVAVFVGATGGIGEYTLKEFAQQTKSPRVYLVGRSQDAADRIVAECSKLNPDGQYTFIQSDISLLKNVNSVCQQILAKEESINLLFQTQGTIVMEKTTEGLAPAYVLPITSRILFALNLLPAIQKASSLKRVVTVLAGGYEGPFYENQWSEYAVKKPFKSRGHLSSMVTMTNNVMARQAPDVSFVHNYPGAVKTNFGKDAKGALMAVGRVAFKILGPVILTFLSPDECAAMQLYGATSARFPPSEGEAVGVQRAKDVPIARGTDGKLGSGSYTINFDGENVSLDVDKHLAKAKADGVEERLWAHILNEIKDKTGKAVGA